VNRAERVARGVIATSAAVFLAAVSHVLAGANAPHVFALLVSVLVVLPFSVALAGKRLSMPRLLAVVLASQALFHASFSFIGAGSVQSGQAAIVAATPHGAHAHGSNILLESVALTPLRASAFMLAFHALAAVVTVVMLRMGERAFVTLATFVTAALAALRERALAVQNGVWVLPQLFHGPQLQPISSQVVATTPRRGPPRFIS